MNKGATRIPVWAGLSILLVLGLGVMPWRLAVSQPARAPHLTRQDLIGAWRLVSIKVSRPDGVADDPFYNADPTGILLYQASGWMSVQIVGQPRPALEAQVARPPRPAPAEEAQRKAAVLDTYYAYFGTWDYDAATSTVTHHIKDSLIPAESGKSYSQTVSLEGETLTFTSKHENAGVTTLQEKVWQRITGPRG